MSAQLSKPVNPRVWIRQAIIVGLIGGFVAVSVALQGMVTTLNDRYIISGLIAVGHFMVVLTFFVGGAIVARRSAALGLIPALLSSALYGLVSSALIVVLIAIGTHVNLGIVLINAIPALYTELTFHLGLVVGSFTLVVVGVVAALVAAVIVLWPPRIARAVIFALVWLIALGLIQDLVTTTLSNWKSLTPLVRFLYSRSGLTVPAALVVFVLVALIYYAAPARTRLTSQAAGLPESTRYLARLVPFALVVLLLVALPFLVGLYLSQVLDDVGLYVLMGLGLNIVVGVAGLLDLGYVAFFAIGAYAVGVLTTPDFGHAPFLPSWWLAVPVAIIAATTAGVILGIPVLKMRGDYLAIVTLGFGEIIRILAISDFLKPYIGGAQGILDIAKPVVLWFDRVRPQASLVPTSIIHPEQFYYIILAACLVVAFIATRVKRSRIGRAWMAIREDEDVAEGMGINLVTYKLLAFGMGAAFGGLSGAIFGSQLGSIFPTSFNFIVSVNVLALIIIGGMGNIPGVIIGALVLVGLPELLREFSDYRFLFYGATLVLMMLLRPEGLLPEARRKLELEENRAEVPAPEEERVAIKTMGEP